MTTTARLPNTTRVSASIRRTLPRVGAAALLWQIRTTWIARWATVTQLLPWTRGLRRPMQHAASYGPASATSTGLLWTASRRSGSSRAMHLHLTRAASCFAASATMTAPFSISTRPFGSIRSSTAPTTTAVSSGRRSATMTVLSRTTPRQLSLIRNPRTPTPTDAGHFITRKSSTGL